MISGFDQPFLGGLFGDPRVSEAWSAEKQIAHYLAFEAALARALEAVGLVSKGAGTAAADSILAFRPDMAELSEATARDGVCIPQLVAGLRGAAGPHGDAVHTGATSQDVIDTALALTLREIDVVLSDDLAGLVKDLSALEERFGANALMGRTRMQAALPITVADRVKTWIRPLSAHVERLDRLRGAVEVLQLGGAVGTRSAWGDKGGEIADHMAAELGIGAPGHAWHSDRTALADYAGCLSLISGTLGKIGQDIALMAQQGIDEVRLGGGGGSSAMPHKSNPVTAELLVTLARFNAAQLSAQHGALVHEQERSGAAWMLEWLVLPPMTAATCRGVTAARALCGKIERLGSAG